MLDTDRIPDIDPCAQVEAEAASAVYFGHFGCLCLLVFGDHRSLPLPQALHLTCLQLGQILLLHVHPAELGAKGIMGNVLLLLGL